MAAAAGKVEPTSKTKRWEADEKEQSRYNGDDCLHVC